MDSAIDKIHNETTSSTSTASKDSLLQQLKELELFEGSPVTLPYVNSLVAWKIGNLAMESAQKLQSPVVIDISSISGQVYFHTVSKDGTSIDNDNWVSRKKRTVFRFGKSSYFIGRKLAIKSAGKSVEEALFVDSKEYATHGGSVPIRISNVDGVWGALTVSGLAQQDDHKFALNILMTIKKILEEEG